MHKAGRTAVSAAAARRRKTLHCRRCSGPPFRSRRGQRGADLAVASRWRRRRSRGAGRPRSPPPAPRTASAPASPPPGRPCRDDAVSSIRDDAVPRITHDARHADRSDATPSRWRCMSRPPRHLHLTPATVSPGPGRARLPPRPARRRPIRPRRRPRDPPFRPRRRILRLTTLLAACRVGRDKNMVNPPPVPIRPGNFPNFQALPVPMPRSAAVRRARPACRCGSASHVVKS